MVRRDEELVVELKRGGKPYALESVYENLCHIAANDEHDGGSG
jgi:hypothetical protein